MGGVRSEKVRRGGRLGVLRGEIQQEQGVALRPVLSSELEEVWGGGGPAMWGAGPGRARGVLQGDLGHWWAPTQGAAGGREAPCGRAFLRLDSDHGFPPPTPAVTEFPVMLFRK